MAGQEPQTQGQVFDSIQLPGAVKSSHTLQSVRSVSSSTIETHGVDLLGTPTTTFAALKSPTHPSMELEKDTSNDKFSTQTINHHTSKNQPLTSPTGHGRLGIQAHPLEPIWPAIRREDQHHLVAGARAGVVLAAPGQVRLKMLRPWKLSKNLGSCTAPFAPMRLGPGTLRIFPPG